LLDERQAAEVLAGEVLPPGHLLPVRASSLRPQMRAGRQGAGAQGGRARAAGRGRGAWPAAVAGRRSAAVLGFVVFFQRCAVLSRFVSSSSVLLLLMDRGIIVISKRGSHMSDGWNR
jgi:hypothetical protein